MTISEEMKRLEADMASDKELNEKFCRTVDRIAGEKTAQSDGELFAKAAQEFGYNITAADFERLDAEKEEVSADELELVAGGGNGEIYFEEKGKCDKDYLCTYFYRYPADPGEEVAITTEDENGHNGVCIAVWHCATITCHTESNSKNINCWSNYWCYIVSKKHADK